MIGGFMNMRDKEKRLTLPPLLPRPRLPSASLSSPPSPNIPPSAASTASVSTSPSSSRVSRLGLSRTASATTTTSTANTIFRATSRRTKKRSDSSSVIDTATTPASPTNSKARKDSKGKEKEQDKYHIYPRSRASSATGSSVSLPELDIVGVVPVQVFQVGVTPDHARYTSDRPATATPTPSMTTVIKSTMSEAHYGKGLSASSSVSRRSNVLSSSLPTTSVESATLATITSRSETLATSPTRTVAPLSPQEQAERERARKQQMREDAAMAKARSKEIDEIMHEQKKLLDKKKKAIQILLLGQSESGKSSIVKNFHLVFAPRKFQSERAVWKIVIQLNIINSIKNILDILQSEWDPITPPKNDDDENLLLLSGEEDLQPPVHVPRLRSKKSIPRYRHQRHDPNEVDDESDDATYPRENIRPKESISTMLHIKQTHPFLIETLNDYKATFGRLLNLEPVLAELLSAEQDQVKTRDHSRFGFGGYGGSRGTTDVCVRAGGGWRRAIMNMRRGSGIGTSSQQQHEAGAAGSSTWLNPASSVVSAQSAESVMESVSGRVSGGWMRKSKKSTSVPTPKPPPIPETEYARSNPKDPTMVLAAMKDDLVRFWEDGKVQSVLERRRLRLIYSPGFFLNDIARIATPDYVPTDEDIVRARVRTLGVEEHHLVIEKGIDAGADVYITDVGGSRSVRPAWIPFFENVQAILFLAPLAFNETLEEDPRVNRLEDSLFLWREICANKLLANSHIILFLNKKDVLEATLAAGVQVRQYVPNYNHSNDVQSVTKYFKNKFHTYMKRASPKPRAFMCYETSAVDTSAMAALLVGGTSTLPKKSTIMLTSFFSFSLSRLSRLPPTPIHLVLFASGFDVTCLVLVLVLAFASRFRSPSFPLPTVLMIALPPIYNPTPKRQNFFLGGLPHGSALVLVLASCLFPFLDLLLALAFALSYSRVPSLFPCFYPPSPFFLPLPLGDVTAI
ncbi:hypothetical protein AX16_009813 [Volvariella volvacea WC 439]|nr:hypothetical protein AX16_009813 [Volvariella volvacea WC 439]